MAFIYRKNCISSYRRCISLHLVFTTTSNHAASNPYIAYALTYLSANPMFQCTYPMTPYSPNNFTISISHTIHLTSPYNHTYLNSPYPRTISPIFPSYLCISIYLSHPPLPHYFNIPIKHDI